MRRASASSLATWRTRWPGYRCGHRSRRPANRLAGQYPPRCGRHGSGHVPGRGLQPGVERGQHARRLPARRRMLGLVAAFLFWSRQSWASKAASILMISSSVRSSAHSMVTAMRPGWAIRWRLKLALVSWLHTPLGLVTASSGRCQSNDRLIHCPATKNFGSGFAWLLSAGSKATMVIALMSFNNSPRIFAAFPPLPME